MDNLILLLIFGPQLLVAVVLHEIAHGWAAEKLGDPTARKLGRITLNPFKHIDPVMTILLPGALIMAHSPVVLGGAKPVPVNPLYFPHPRRGMAIVAIAGPVMNLILATLSFGIYSALLAYHEIFPPVVSEVLIASFQYGVMINTLLATFNMLPIPPLDGGRILVGLLPSSLARAYSKIERFGIVIVFMLLLGGYVEKIFAPVLQFLHAILDSGAAELI